VADGRLLNGDSAAQCVEDAPEHQHQPVAQVLHFPPPAGGDGLPQEREVDPAHLLGQIVTHYGRSLCGLPPTTLLL